MRAYGVVFLKISVNFASETFNFEMVRRLVLAVILFCSACAVFGQARWGRWGVHHVRRDTAVVAAYVDSLLAFKAKADSVYAKADSSDVSWACDSRFFKVFAPLTFYHSVVRRNVVLGDSCDGDVARVVDDALLSAYIEHPEHVEFTEGEIDEAGSLHEEITEPLRHKVRYAGRYDVAPDFTPDVPVEIVVEKPNFWKFSGDYYLQFLQNYVSGNWYKGGESNYSMLASVTLQANYNNKQEVIFENKLELKLGLQTSREDSLHGLKTSEDLIRYTGKLGLKATKNWYYTLQLIASTQFMRGYKSNDPVVYSDILSPLNLNFSLGMSYSVNALDGKLTGSIQLSPLAYNFRYVARDELATQYSLKEGHHTLNDFGSGCTFDLTWAMSELIKWKTRLYCYTTYKRTEMEWENTLTFKFNRFISTNLFIYPRFDDGSSARDNDFGYWQFKEYASIGFAYSF